MAKYYIVRPGIHYRCRSGFEVFAPYNANDTSLNVFDTADPRRDVPDPFVPPVIGLRPGDAAAKTALDAARAPYANGTQWPGLGVVDPDEPIWSP